MTLNPDTISAVFLGITFIVFTFNQELKSTFQKYCHSPKQLKDIVVVRSTNRTHDVLLESRIDDDWNVDGDRELSVPWTGVTHSSEQQATIWIHVVQVLLNKSSGNIQAR